MTQSQIAITACVLGSLLIAQTSSAQIAAAGRGAAEASERIEVMRLQQALRTAQQQLSTLGSELALERRQRQEAEAQLKRSLEYQTEKAQGAAAPVAGPERADSERIPVAVDYPGMENTNTAGLLMLITVRDALRHSTLLRLVNPGEQPEFTLEVVPRKLP